MKLESKILNIVTTKIDDQEVKDLLKASPDNVNMSETFLYPDGTPTEMLFRIEKNSELVGFVKLSRIRWFNRKCELSILIDKAHQGKGIASEAMKSVIQHAFNKMNLHRLEAEVIEFNKASIKLMEKFGFKKEGVLREAKFNNGKYYNIIRYGLLRNEWIDKEGDK